MEIAIEKEKINNANSILYEEIKKDFFDNYVAIQKIADFNDEIEALKNVYMNKAYQALINSIDDNETTCPACNTGGIHNLKERFQQKKKIFEESKKSLFGKFKFINDIDTEEQINNLIQLAKNLNGKEVAELIICDVNNDK